MIECFVREESLKAACFVDGFPTMLHTGREKNTNGAPRTHRLQAALHRHDAQGGDPSTPKQRSKVVAGNCVHCQQSSRCRLHERRRLRRSHQRVQDLHRVVRVLRCQHLQQWSQRQRAKRNTQTHDSFGGTRHDSARVIGCGRATRGHTPSPSTTAYPAQRPPDAEGTDGVHTAGVQGGSHVSRRHSKWVLEQALSHRCQHVCTQRTSVVGSTRRVENAYTIHASSLWTSLGWGTARRKQQEQGVWRRET